MASQALEADQKEDRSANGSFLAAAAPEGGTERPLSPRLPTLGEPGG